MTRKAPVKLPPPTNQHSAIYKPDALPVAQPTLSEYWMEMKSSNKKLSRSLRFNSHFPGEPRLAGINWSKGWRKWWWQLLTGAISCANLQSNHHHQQTNNKSFLRPDALPVAQSTEGKISHTTDLLTPSSPGVFQLCLWPLITPGYPWGKVAMPLISPLMQYLSALEALCDYALYKSTFTLHLHYPKS